MIYLKLFQNNTEYNAYTADTANFIKPNVSLTVDNNTLHYNPIPPIETRVVAKYNVTDTSNPTPIGYNEYTSGFSEIEIDGVVQPSVVSAYTFDTEGEHTVKYTLTDPTSIGSKAFTICSSLTSIDIPNSVTSIGTSAFEGCSGLTSIDIPSGVTSIGNQAFRDCSSLTSIAIPSGVTRIGGGTFMSCSGLTSIDIPDSVTSIGSNAFEYCSGLTSIEIPSGVTSIGVGAFFYCSSLTSIVSNATTAPTIQLNTFQNVKTLGTLTVPIGSSGYDTWMQNASYYLGLYGWTKVEQ